MCLAVMQHTKSLEDRRAAFLDTGRTTNLEPRFRATRPLHMHMASQNRPASDLKSELKIVAV